MTQEFLKLLRKKFVAGLASRETWGSGEVQALFDGCLAEAAVEAMDERPIVAPHRRPPSRLSGEEWRDLALRCGTMAQFHAETGYDPKTIAKYLRRFSIENPWARVLE